MEKKRFDFYQDVKVTVWARQKFTIEAESKEEALKMVEKFKTEDIGTSEDSHLIWDTEWMTETWEDIPVEENGGCATIELYDGENKKMIGDNAKPGLSAMAEERKLIGYQVLDVNADIPDGLFSFQVFRSEQDAKDFIEERGLKECTIHEVYDGDIEEPSYLGKKPRTFKQGERVFNCEYCEGDRDLHGWATVCHDTEVEEEDAIVLIEMENGGENETTAESLYQIAEGKVCPRCGGPLCIEHHDEIDYPYFCPSCDENFYGIEVQ